MRRAVAVLVLVLAAAPAARGREAAGSVATEFPIAAYRLHDLDGDGAAELVLVGTEGTVRVWRASDDGALSGPFGDLVLPDPKRSLLWIGDPGGSAAAASLVVLSSTGVSIHPLGEDGGFSAKGRRTARRASFRLRVGAPVFSEILRDVNGDGRPDLIVPGTGDRIPQDAEQCQIWLNRGPRSESSPVPVFQQTATVRSVLKDSRETGGTAISDRLENSFRIPDLDFRDVNGDGRQDLIVVDGDKRGFHLQTEDGSIPNEPDVRLDLSIFRDTTPEGSIRPGHVLAGGDDAQLTTTDLDADGIPDYLIAHRRKIWVFHGSRDGPSFTEPWTILRVTEDVSALLVLPLDGDDRPDLLILRVMIPSVASIVSGLLSELSVEISARGYAGRDSDRVFSQKPDWSGSLTVVLPDVIGMLRDPGALLGKFQDTASRFRRTAFGDFDGDGARDVAMVSEDETRVDLWLLAEGAMGEAEISGLRGLFFSEEDREWDLEKVLEWLGNVARERARRLTGEREPDLAFPLRPESAWEILGFTSADTDGDGADEVVIVYRNRETDRGQVDVLRRN
jgi:hypothetical protein